MSVDVKVPMLPESISEAELATWHKKEGDFCQEGEVIAELETDKVMLEVVATQSGVLSSLKFSEGDTVLADAVIAVLEPQASKSEEKAKEASDTKPEEKPATQAVSDIPASPSVRREIQQQNIDVSQIQGSGRGGRIVEQDLLTQSNRVKMSRMRAKIAEIMVEAQHSAAMLTTFNEVNMEPVMTLRSDSQEAFQKKHEVKLGFMSFFVQAVSHALKDFPEVNASIDGEDILYHQDANIGIAVSTDRGLVVPVLRKAQEMSYAEIESQIKHYAEKAREGKIELADMSDGTFTITNGGVFGSMLSTPILNMPQSAILGMHAITKRVVVEDDQMVIRPMMYLALTYDHRLIDGQQSVQFLVNIKESLENPSKLLLDI